MARTLSTTLPLIFENVFGESELVSIRVVQPGEGPFGVTFAVKEMLTNKPIKGATIQINGEVITTDENGMATLTVTGGKRIIIVSKSGYWTKTSTKTISTDQTMDVFLVPIWMIVGGGAGAAAVILTLLWALRR